jgi:hypothetical protein
MSALYQGLLPLYNKATPRSTSSPLAWGASLPIGRNKADRAHRQRSAHKCHFFTSGSKCPRLSPSVLISWDGDFYACGDSVTLCSNEVTILYCAATYTCTSLSRRSCSRSFSTSRSYRACRFIQNRSDKPKYRDSRNAVSGVIARLPCTISLIRRGGTLMSLANRYWLIPIGSKNSSNRISPG